MMHSVSILAQQSTSYHMINATQDSCCAFKPCNKQTNTTIQLDFLCFIFPFLFQVILTLPVGPESVIAIWDCPLDILKALLAFMYQGKVQVMWDDLRDILS